MQLETDEFDPESEFDFESFCSFSDYPDYEFANHSVPFLMILIMNLQLDADEFDHESEFDFEAFCSFFDDPDYELAT